MIALVAAAVFGLVVGCYLVAIHWQLMGMYHHQSLELDEERANRDADLLYCEELTDRLEEAWNSHRAEHRRCVYLSEALAKLRSMSAAVGNLAPGFNLAVLIDDMLRAAPPGAVPPRQPQTEPTIPEEEDNG